MGKEIDVRFITPETLKRHEPKYSLYGYYHRTEDGMLKIRIDKTLPPKKKLEIVIHEFLHASRESLSEEYVTEVSAGLTDVICKLCDYDYSEENYPENEIE